MAYIKTSVLLFNIFLFQFIHACAFAQSKGYDLTCKIAGVPDGTTFFLVKNGGSDTVATTKIMKGIFKFTGYMDKEGELHFIKLDTTVLKLTKGRKSYVRLLLDHSKIKISGNLEEWPKVKIEGSVATQSFEKLIAEVQSIRDETIKKCDQIFKQFDDDERTHKINDEKTRYYNFLYSYLMKNKNSLATPFLVYNYTPDSIAYIKSLYDAFPKKVRNGYYASCLVNERIPTIKARIQIQVGKQIPEINSLQDREGNPVSISTIASKGKITLIDFWASWCKPCRAAIPELKKVYKEFHDKGFNIVGVSHDKKKDAWLKAMSDDEIDWFNVIDSKMTTSDLFQLRGIPAYVLINKSGNIIAFAAISSIPSFGPSLRIEDLQKTLVNLLNN